MHSLSPDKALLEAVDVSKSFDRGAVRALDGVSLSVLPGETLAIVGPSGSGKTTLLQVLGTLRSPDRGGLFFRGVSYREIRSLVEFRRREMGFVFQLPTLVPVLSVEENVVLPLAGSGMPREEMRARARRLLALAGCASLAARRASRLSAGEQQRVSVCRAFVNHPGVVLADEPTGFLDRAGRQRVMELMDEFNRELGTALVVVTHDPEVAGAMRRRLVLREGRIVPGGRAG